MDCILAIDAGSSSMRGVLFTETGTECARSVQQYRMRPDDAEAVEMEASVFAGALGNILRDITDKAKKEGWSIAALGLTSQRSSVLALDSRGEALRPILMWHDKRSSGICDTVNEDAASVYGICGMKASPVFSAPKMRWLKENERSVYDNAAKLVGIHDYLLFLLTGRMMTDVSLASRTNLLDLGRGEWSPELLERFGLERDKLCDIAPAGVICGVVRGNFAREHGLGAGVPVVSCGGDQQCAALGMGVLAPGDACVNTGSAAFVTAATQKPVFDPQMRVLCNAASVPGMFVVEGGTLSAGLAYQWCAEEFCGGNGYSEANSCCATSEPGAGGVIMTPSFAGKGAPYWDHTARAFFHNVSFAAKREDFVRATLEGVVAELADCLETVRDVVGVKAFAETNCAGGLTRLDVFNEILADSCNTALRCFSDEESGTRGVWMIVAVNLGLFGSHAAAFAAATRDAGVRWFRPNAERHALYARINKARRYIYDAVDMRTVREILSGAAPCPERGDA